MVNKYYSYLFMFVFVIIKLLNIAAITFLSIDVWASEISEIVAANSDKEAKPFVSPLVTADTILNATKDALTIIVSEGYANLNTVFERVIGLGHWCLTKGQINKYFAPKLHLMNTKKGQADLFDWLYIHDYAQFAIALRHKLEDFFERKDFYVKDGKSKVIYNRKYKMEWNHIFSGNSNLMENILLADSDHVKDVRNELREKELELLFSSITGKINYLKDKFISAKGNKTLYIISHPRQDLNLETLVKVRDSLTIIREGDKNFCLLYVPQVKIFEGVENIIVREAKNLTKEWDGADTQRWKQILDEFKFTPGIWQ